MMQRNVSAVHQHRSVDVTPVTWVLQAMIGYVTVYRLNKVTC